MQASELGATSQLARSGSCSLRGYIRGIPVRSCPTTGHSQMMLHYSGVVVTAVEVLALIRFTIACFLPCHQRRSHTCRSMVPRTCFALCVIELLFWSIWAKFRFNLHRKLLSSDELVIWRRAFSSLRPLDNPRLRRSRISRCSTTSQVG